jgi:hypothetical protein
MIITKVFGGWLVVENFLLISNLWWVGPAAIGRRAKPSQARWAALPKRLQDYWTLESSGRLRVFHGYLRWKRRPALWHRAQRLARWRQWCSHRTGIAALRSGNTDFLIRYPIRRSSLSAFLSMIHLPLLYCSFFASCGHSSVVRDCTRLLQCSAFGP